MMMGVAMGTRVPRIVALGKRGLQVPARQSGRR
jgi:hypothetical protein